MTLNQTTTALIEFGIDARLSEQALKVLVGLQRALPREEWLPVRAWLSTFYVYQLEWLLDWERFSLLNKARQIGASHTYAAAAILWAMFGETTTVVSVGEREAIEVLDKARGHAKALELLGSKWAKLVTKTATEIRLASGGRVLALPSTSGGRSFSGNVLLDEFAYHVHPDKVWDGAGGTVLHGYKLRVMSTPNGVGNLWYELLTDPERSKGFRIHEVTLDQAIADGLKVDLDACWKQARNDPRVFDQLFRGKFLDNDLQYIGSDLIKAATVTAEELITSGNCYGGIDVGETRDKTVLLIVRRSSKTRAVIHCESHGRTDDPLLDDLAQKAFTKFGVRRLCIDATGVGAMPSIRMQKKFGHSKLEPIKFTLNIKEDLATGLYAVMAANELQIPKQYIVGNGDEAALLRDDICSIRRLVTQAGNVRYDAPRTAKGHADRAWALMLALHGAARETQYGGVTNGGGMF